MSLVMACILLSSCGPTSSPALDGSSSEAGASPSDWTKHGRTSSEQRFSPLQQINRDTVDGLGLDWSYEFDTSRGQEATPLVIDGVIYTTTA